MNNKNDIAKKSIALHAKHRGKIEMRAKTDIKNRADLSLVYTPGVGAVCMEIARDPKLADKLTWRKNTVAVVSDGSAVLGLGNIGPAAAIPVMEGKCAIFKKFANIDAVPIVLDTQDTNEIIAAVKAIAPSFGAIQLEDISAPRCFEIEEKLTELLDKPVVHDDQHGTAIVTLGALINSFKLTKRKAAGTRVVINGAGAAGTAIAKLLVLYGIEDVIVCDRKGAIYAGREDLNSEKRKLAQYTNPNKLDGDLTAAAKGADVLIGVSGPGLFSAQMVKNMKKNPIILALANPTPEIMPDEAKAAGAFIVATGRSDFANQVNNALVYPGLFRGMLDKNIKTCTNEIKIRAAKALAGAVKKPTADKIIPGIFDKGLAKTIAKAAR